MGLYKFVKISYDLINRYICRIQRIKIIKIFSKEIKMANDTDI